jgi:hypothetical protein
MRRVVALNAVMFVASALLGTAAAQERPRPAVEITAGWMGFADDGIVSESMVGGAARWYWSRRASVGPELVYMSGSNHNHLAMTGNVTYDLVPPNNGRSRLVMPFLVAGGGLFQTRETFFDDDFVSTDGAFTAGGGVRVSASDRVFIGIDSRVGWELHLRVNGFLAVQLGR